MDRYPRRTRGAPLDSNGRRPPRRLPIISRRLRSSPKRRTRMEPLVEHQFDDIEQQRDAAYTGMWIFLSTEVLFFGAVFFAYILYRGMYYDGFVEASRKLSLTMGSVNTAV